MSEKYPYQVGAEVFWLTEEEIQKRIDSEWDGQRPRQMTPEEAYQHKFTVKDSGKREHFDSGMQRDTNENKPRFDLVFDGPMLKRWAEQLRKGAVKYNPRNWMQANSEIEAQRFRESAIRHFFQWLDGDTDEDHAAATFFNVNGYEYTKERIHGKEEVR